MKHDYWNKGYAVKESVNEDITLALNTVSKSIEMMAKTQEAILSLLQEPKAEAVHTPEPNMHIPKPKADA